MKKRTTLFKPTQGCWWGEAPCRVWNITPDTAAGHHKQTFGSGFGPKQTANSAGRQRTHTSINTQPDVVRHHRLNLTWKEFPVLGAQSVRNSTCCWQIRAALPTRAAFGISISDPPAVLSECEDQQINPSTSCQKIKSFARIWTYSRTFLQVIRRYSSHKNSFRVHQDLTRTGTKVQPASATGFHGR